MMYGNYGWDPQFNPQFFNPNCFYPEAPAADWSQAMQYLEWLNLTQVTQPYAVCPQVIPLYYQHPAPFYPIDYQSLVALQLSVPIYQLPAPPPIAEPLIPPPPREKQIAHLISGYQDAILKMEMIGSTVFSHQKRIDALEEIRKTFQDDLIQKTAALIQEVGEANAEEDLKILYAKLISAENEINLHVGLACLERDLQNKSSTSLNGDALTDAYHYLTVYLHVMFSKENAEHFQTVEKFTNYIAQVDPNRVEICKQLYALSKLILITHLNTNLQEHLDLILNRFQVSTAYIGQSYMENKQEGKFSTDMLFAITQYNVSVVVASDDLEQRELIIQNYRDAQKELSHLEARNEMGEDYLSPYRTLICGSYDSLFLVNQIALLQIKSLTEIFITIRKVYDRHNPKLGKFVVTKGFLQPELSGKLIADLLETVETGTSKIREIVAQKKPRHTRQLCAQINHLLLVAEYLYGVIGFVSEIDRKNLLEKPANHWLEKRCHLLKLEIELLKVLVPYGVPKVHYELNLAGEIPNLEVLSQLEAFAHRSVPVILKGKIKDLARLEKHAPTAQPESSVVAHGYAEAPVDSEDGVEKARKSYRELLKELDFEEKRSKAMLAKLANRKQFSLQPIVIKEDFQNDAEPVAATSSPTSSVSAVVPKVETDMQSAYDNYHQNNYSAALQKFQAIAVDNSFSNVQRYKAALGCFYCHYTPAIGALKRNQLASAAQSLSQAEGLLKQIYGYIAQDQEAQKEINFEVTVEELREDLKVLIDKTIHKIEKHAIKVHADFEASLNEMEAHMPQSFREKPLSQTPEAQEYRQRRQELALQTKRVSKQMTQIPLLRKVIETPPAKAASSLTVMPAGADPALAQRLSRLYQDGFSNEFTAYRRQLDVSKKMHRYVFEGLNSSLEDA